MGQIVALEASEAGKEGLLRVLGPAFAIAVGLGGVIGGGILRTPATVVDAVPVVGLALALWIIVGIHSALEANSVSEVMTAVPRAGGLFVPATAAFGSPGGLLVGWTDWLGWVAAAAVLSILSAEFLALVVDGLQAHVAPIGAGILFAITALNWLGIREGSRIQIVGSVAKALFLLGIVALIFVAAPPQPAEAGSAVPVSLTLAGVIVAYQTIYGAYAGWTSSSYFAEEDRDPGKNIPRGMFTTILLVVVLYTLVSGAVSYALPLETLRNSSLPVADALVATVGPVGLKVIAAGAVLIALTCLNAQIMAAPRILYGLANGGMFPKIALKVNSGGTPTVALGITFLVALGLTLTGEFETVFLIMAALGLMPILVALAALFKLRRDAPDLPRPYRAKLYPWLPAAVLILDIGMLIAFLANDWGSGLFIVAAVALALPIGLLMRRSGDKPIAGQPIADPGPAAGQ